MKLSYLERSPSSTLQLGGGVVAAQATLFYGASKNSAMLLTISLALLLSLMVALTVNLFVAKQALFVRLVAGVLLIAHAGFWIYVWFDFWTRVD